MACAAVFWLFAVVWAADIAGLFRRAGSSAARSSRPFISPKKTWAGSSARSRAAPSRGLARLGLGGLCDRRCLGRHRRSFGHCRAGRRPVQIGAEALLWRQGFGHASFPAMAASSTGSMVWSCRSRGRACHRRGARSGLDGSRPGTACLVTMSAEMLSQWPAFVVNRTVEESRSNGTDLAEQVLPR